mgnify:CR=1 FL=1
MNNETLSKLSIPAEKKSGRKSGPAVVVAVVVLVFLVGGILFFSSGSGERKPEPMPTAAAPVAVTNGPVKAGDTVLTVRAGQAHSHASLGWETFTDKVISLINEHREGVVFLLWGAHAQKKGAIIDRQRHCVLKAPHPSPLSAHRGFFGSNHFVQTNQWLAERGESPIDWMPVLPAESG